jgi:hypothetical protein
VIGVRNDRDSIVLVIVWLALLGVLMLAVRQMLQR